MKKDLAKAYKWFSLAAAHGDAEAAKRREVIRVQLPGGHLGEGGCGGEGLEGQARHRRSQRGGGQSGLGQGTGHQGRFAGLPGTDPTQQLGYNVGPPDGLIGPRTQSAIKLFQLRNGLSETGEVTIPLVTQFERLTS